MQGALRTLSRMHTGAAAATWKRRSANLWSCWSRFLDSFASLSRVWPFSTLLSSAVVIRVSLITRRKSSDRLDWDKISCSGTGCGERLFISNDLCECRVAVTHRLRSCSGECGPAFTVLALKPTFNSIASQAHDIFSDYPRYSELPNSSSACNSPQTAYISRKWRIVSGGIWILFGLPQQRFTIRDTDAGLARQLLL